MTTWAELYSLGLYDLVASLTDYADNCKYYKYMTWTRPPNCVHVQMRGPKGGLSSATKLLSG